ncbi:MAG TPA: GntR family transcriptional regulator, partial [Micrococcaceae bacterium]
MTFTEALEDLRTQARGAKHAETGLWVSRQLRQRIAAGQLAPGTKLAEEALCEALGVSRNTLREAFTSLHAEHIITRIPNRGVFVAHPSAEDIREIYRVRRYLEPAALMWSPSRSVTDLEAIVARARKA